MGLHNKYIDEEDKIARKKQSSKKYYEKNKNDPEFKEKRRIWAKSSSKAYYNRNRESIIIKQGEYNMGPYYEKYKQNHRNYYQKKSALEKKKEVARVKLYREKQRLVKLQVKLDTKKIVLKHESKP